MNFKKLIPAAAILFTVSGVAVAETDFPQRPVQLVVPYSAGGGMDVVARTIAKSMGNSLNQTVVILNVPGAGTAIGASQVARAKPDGYTILWGDNATFAYNKYLYNELAYDPAESFTPISQTMSGAVTLGVSEKLGVKTVPELLALLRAAPGKYNYASAGVGSPHHLAMEKMKRDGGVDMMHIPYKGESAAVNDLMSGEVAAMFLGDTMARLTSDSGKVRLLATAGPTRNPLFPDVPTLAEAGIPGFESIFWHALVAPKGTPPEVIAKLNKAYADALADPEVATFLATNNTGLKFRVTTPEETAAFMKDELQRAGELMSSLDINSP